MKDIRKLLNIVKNKKLLIIFPHPDDESFASAGLILVAKKLGYTVNLLTLTKGGAGRVCINPNGKSLKEVREDELLKAVKILGVDKLIVKDYDDGKLKVRNGWGRAVVEELTKFKPGMVVTYDPTGITGHPDHINVSLGVKKIIRKTSTPKPVLLWVTFGNKQYVDRIPEKIREYITPVSYELSLNFSDIIQKTKAMFCHRSQKYEHLFEIIVRMLIFRKEWYHKVNLYKDYLYKYIEFKI